MPRSFKRLTVTKHIVLTSVTAVVALIEITQRLQRETSEWLVYCIDGATRQMATKLCLEIAGTAPDAKRLAEVIISQGTKEVTFICSNKRLPTLPTLLQENGIIAYELEAYQTTLSPSKPGSPFDAVLFFSPSTIDSYLKMNAPSARCFCIGETTAAHARANGFAAVHVAGSASEEALVATAINFYNKEYHAQK